jgi:DNA-binding MarR family transcriptional regulator
VKARKNRGNKPAGVGPSIGVLMFVAHRAMEQRIVDVIRAAGYTDTTLAQGRVFARIGQDGTRLTDLAEMAQVTKQTASFLVDQLEKGGYVERVADPTDGRARLVRISAKGRQAQAVAAREEQAIYREWEEHLGARDMARLADILQRLREVTDPYRELDPAR